MFSHKGNTRNINHNIGIASLLSFVAGIVNVMGLLSIQKLTTNVTGHFAFMVEEATLSDFNQSMFYFIYIFFFFLGAFFSNFIIEITQKVTVKHIYFIPVLVEAFLLLIISFLNFSFIISNPNLIACVLLFAMGLQNSLVTTISNSVVRTTHLTGLFTDLGIEISQLFFYKSNVQRLKLYSMIKLRTTIITTFFIGGILAGLFFPTYKMKTLLIASFVLIVGLIIDYINVKLNETK